jgi:carbon monoxide dehydrogenase subunit G
VEIDKSLQIAATPDRIWTVLLDPQAMAKCVPGMQSVEVISPDEYAALMHVKIAFVSAKFKLRTRIVERREPYFLKAEGTGEDASVASSLKQVTELTLSLREDGQTDLRVNVKVDLLGRMGSFGLSVMKTKADRLWDEFGVNLSALLAENNATSVDQKVSENQLPGAPSATYSAPISNLQTGAKTLPRASADANVSVSMWQRFLHGMGIQTVSNGSFNEVIVVEVQRPDQTKFRIEWPAGKSQDCAIWLRDALR